MLRRVEGLSEVLREASGRGQSDLFANLRFPLIYFFNLHVTTLVEQERLRGSDDRRAIHSIQSEELSSVILHNLLQAPIEWTKAVSGELILLRAHFVKLVSLVENPGERSVHRVKVENEAADHIV